MAGGTYCQTNAKKFQPVLFCTYWYNFQEQMIKLAKYFVQFQLKKH